METQQKNKIPDKKKPSHLLQNPVKLASISPLIDFKYTDTKNLSQTLKDIEKTKFDFYLIEV